MSTTARERPGAPRPRSLRRPVFVVAAPGVDTSALVAGLVAADDRRALRADGPTLLAAVPRLQPANRGWDSGRLGLQDAKRAVVAELESAWSTMLDAGGPTPATARGVVVAYDEAALHVPFLHAAWPDARFVLVTGDEAASRADLEAAWSSGTRVTQPDLPDWDGPAWSLLLVPGWRHLRGRPLAEIVGEQHRSAQAILRADLAAIPPGAWTEVEVRDLVRDRAEVVDRVRRFLHTAPSHDEAAPSPFRSVNTPTVPQLLDRLGTTLLATTYQSGCLVMARAVDGALNTHFRRFASPMGMAYRPGMLAIGTKGRIQTFTDLPGFARGLTEDGRHDACFVPRTTHHTGDIRVHDVAWAGGRLWAVATRFSALVTLDGQHSFVPRWRPPFVTELVPEDRCHLNGLAVVDDRVKYVTALGTSDVEGGWRASKVDGGVIMDVETDEVVVDGLSMPHSPRWYRDQLWVLESGRGHLSRVDLKTGGVECVAELPGFTRGLAFAGRYAFVGLSEVREATTFGGLPLTARLEDRECGVWVVDIVTGETVGYLRFQDHVQEIFDVALLPGIRFPELLDDSSSAHLHAFALPPDAV